MQMCKVLTKAFTFTASSTLWELRWIAEEELPRIYDWQYDETKPPFENANRLADDLMNKLVRDYSVIGVDPNPKLVPIWGGDEIGVEMYYRNQEGLKRISARVFMHSLI